MKMIGNYQLRGFAAQKSVTEQHPSLIFNLKKALAAVMLLVVAFTSYAQVDGDYQSKTTPANWGAAASWQVYSGGTWVDAGNYPGQAAGAGTVTIQNGHTITLNVSPANAIGALVVGQGTTGTLTGDAAANRTITTGSLTVSAGGTFTLNRTILIVNGVTSISGTMTDANANGSMTYVGQFRVNSGGIYTNTSTSASTFRGGFENNGTYTSSSTGTHLFNTNPQTIEGTGATAISGAVTVTGVAVTNEATNFRINSTLAGTGSWTQAANSILLVGGTGSSLTITTVDFTATGNKVNYCRNGTQSVRATTYYHLTDSVANVKTLLGNITVNGNLEIKGTCTMACAQYQITGNATGVFTMATGTFLTLGNALDATDVLFPTNFTAGNITLSGTASVTYQNLGTQTVSHVPAYRNLTISTATSTKTVTGNLTVGGTLIVNTGATLVLGGSTTTSAVTGAATITGTLNLGTACTTATFGSTCAIGGNLTFNGTSTKTVTIAGALSGAGTLDMSGGTLAHHLRLGGATNTVTTFTTAAGSTVTYYGGTQTILTTSNYRNLHIESSGTKSTGGIIVVAEDFYVDSLATFNPAGNAFTVSGNTTLYYGTIGDALIGGTTNLQNVELINGTFNGAANGVVNVNGKLSMLSGNGTLGRVQITVTDTTKVGAGRTLLMNNNNGIKRFNSVIQVIGTGVVTATGITTTTNLDLRAGITVEAAGGSFAGGAAIFNANQNLAGLGPISFANATTIAAGIVVTNTNTQGVTLTGTLNGANATSEWVQGANSVAYYRSATQPMATGILTASASDNFFHYSLGAAQTVEPATYYNLTFSGGGNFFKTLGGNITVNGAFQLNPSTYFNPSTFNMTVVGVSTIAGNIQDASATGAVDFADVDLSGGTITHATINGVFDINGNLSMPSSNGTIGRGTVTVYGTTTIASGRTLQLTVNNAGIKQFDGQIIVQGSGIFNSTAITTAGNLVIRGGIDVQSASGAFNATIATLNGNQDLEGVGPISFAGAVTVSSNMTVTNLNTYRVTFGGVITGGNAASTYQQGVNSVTYYQPAANTAPMVVGVLDASGTNNTFFYNTAGAQNIRVPLTNYYHLRLSGGSNGIKTLLNNTTATGKLTIAAATSLQVAGFNISVGDSTIIDGTFNDNNDAGTNTFTGHVHITSTPGTLSTANASPFVFEGGITNDGTFNKSGTGAVSFNSNDQDINGSATMTLAGNITIGASRTVTYRNTSAGGLVTSGILNGSNASSTWVNEVNSTVYYNCTASANRPMATGLLDASAAGNNFYYSRTNAQTLKTPVDGYYNLFVSGGAFTKTLSGNTLVLGNMSIAATCTLSVDNTQNYSLTVHGDFLNSGVFQPYTGTLTFNGTADQVFMPSGITFHNVVVDNSGTEVTISGSNLTITGTLTLNNGVITTGSNMVVLTSTNENSLTGYSSASFINGTLRRSITTNTSTYAFPVGNGTGPTNYYRADVINNGLQGVSYLTASFGALSNHNDGDINTGDYWETGSLVYDAINPAGMWTIETNGNVVPSDGDYAIKLYTANMTGLTDNNFGPLKRPVGMDGTAWTVGSGRLSNNNGDGRLVANGYAIRTGLGTFSEFGVGSGSGSGHGLPIELVSFNATVIGDAVRLDWETATETNNHFFTIERSSDGERFDELAVVEGAGNSAQPRSYESMDLNPLGGVSYYRLKQTDYNGDYAYSDVVSVTVNKDGLFTISPNPVVGGSKIVVSLNQEEITGGAEDVTITDMTGRTVYTQVLGLWENPTLHLELPADLGTGIYMLTVKCLNNTLQKKILVQ